MEVQINYWLLFLGLIEDFMIGKVCWDCSRVSYQSENFRVKSIIRGESIAHAHVITAIVRAALRLC